MFRDNLINNYGKALAVYLTCRRDNAALLSVCYYLYDSFRYVLLDMVKCTDDSCANLEAVELLQKFNRVMSPEMFFMFNSVFTYLVSCLIDREFTDLDIASINNLIETIKAYINGRELSLFKNTDNLLLVGIYNNKTFQYSGICYDF